MGLDNADRFGVLDFPCGAERLSDGSTIIADAGDEQQAGSELILVDKKGQIIWNYAGDLLFPHSAVPTGEDSFLVSDTTNNRVLEINTNGTVLFSSENWSGGTGLLSDGTHLDYPNDAHPLPDNRLIITDRNNDRCIIVTRSGEILWEFSDGIKHPHNAEVLPNGNVIIADSDHNRIIEVTPEKTIQWSYGDEADDSPLAWPRDADRLENGNTLICDSKNNRVLEVTPDHAVVWEYAVSYFANFYEADRLSNGNTLIVDQQHQRVFEVDPGGTVVWQFRNHLPAVAANRKIVNSGFQERGKDGIPAEWHLLTRVAEGGGMVRWETDERDRPYPVLQFDRSGAVALFQLVRVHGGRRYRIAATLRTHNMSEGSFACLQLAYRDEYGGWFEDVFDSPKGSLYEGETTWDEDMIEVIAPREARSVEVRILLVGAGEVHIRRVLMVST